MAFKKGVSGNPSGRKKGVPNKRGVIAGVLDKISTEKGLDVKQAIIEKLIDSALDGDTQSIKLIMDRLEPAYKPVSPPISLDARLPSDNIKRAEKLLDLTAQGKILPDETKMLIDGMKSVLQIKEFTEMEQRIEALENEGRRNE